MRVLGIGVDVVDVSRVRRMLQRYDRFTDRVFTPEEVRYCTSKREPAPCLAARWAAREACRKALGGVRGMRWHDVRVDRARTGAPSLVLEGAVKERAAHLGVSEVLVSFTHERDTAVAFCMAVAG